MKKIATLLAVVLVLGISLVVYAAGADKVDFVQTDACDTVDNEIHANAGGFVIINQTPGGTTEVAIQIQIRDAAPGWTYAVYSGDNLLGCFTTNKKGYGHLHCNLSLEDILGGYINIWNQVKPGATRLLRAEIL